MTGRLDNFPRIPHFPGSCGTTDDLWLAEIDQTALWQQPLVVLEKRDGINVALACEPSGNVTVELRGGFHTFARGDLAREVWLYASQRAAAYRTVLGPHEVLYGEWLKPRLTIAYTRLPDWLIVFALRKRDGSFVPFVELARRVGAVGLTVATPLHVGPVRGLRELKRWLGPSPLGAAQMEGLIVEPLQPGPGPRFAKWVRPGFVRRLPDVALQKCNRLSKHARCLHDVSVMPKR